MPRKWEIKPKVTDEFCKRFEKYSTLAVQLMYNRGLETEEEVEKFINPRYEDLNDPFLFKDMEKAVNRIWQAVEQGEGICIYGDYDADAVTANAVLQQTFRYLGINVGNYIPDRFTEGYGLNLDAFEKIKNEGCKVVITVDCGTNSVDVAEFCKREGMDLIITDHHEIIGETPDSYALINPKNPNDAYPYREITGVGVAFKLACGILSHHDKVTTRLSSRTSASDLSAEASAKVEIRDPKNNHDADSRPEAGMTHKNYTGGYEKWLLDLVAIGTVADCHSLLGENRILVKFGLKVLAKTKWAGLRALTRTADLDFTAKPPDTYTLGFIIAPRLNAAGRLEHANIALHLLMEEDPVSAQQRSFELEMINKRRQELTERVMSEAREQAQTLSGRKILVLWGEEWPKGVVGLAAGKIAEEFNKPTIVLEKNSSESTGSARTVGDFDIVEALKATAFHLVKFGGHKQAAGLTVRTEEYEQFYQAILEYTEKTITDEDLNRVLELEMELDESDLQLATFNVIIQFEPFGVHNPRPKFKISRMEVLGTRVVGSARQHLQIQLKLGSTVISGIGFNLAHFAKKLNVGDTVDVAAELIEDSWNGRQGVKLRVIDINKQ